MSVLRCDGAGCSKQVDTDLDSECAVDDPRHSLAGHPDLILCENCREKLAAELERSP